MPNESAGLLLYRRRNDQLEVLLVHPGGPLWRNKDAGAWSIPKGGINDGEDRLAAACREFHEETGFDPAALNPSDKFTPLKSIQQKSGKTVHAWALAGDCDPSAIRSNTFTMEFPPRSGKQVEFPEVDRGEFFSLSVAREKILPAQIPLLDELEKGGKPLRGLP